MNLKFACSDQFESAEEIAKGIQAYLPKLIQNVEIVRTEAFVGIFEVWDARSKVERIIEPNWKLMLQLEHPLDFDDISARVEDIYRLKPKPGAGPLRRFFRWIGGGISSKHFSCSSVARGFMAWMV